MREPPETNDLVLERYRDYLRLLARLQVGRRLRGSSTRPIWCSSLSCGHTRRLDQFQGTQECERVAWLRRSSATTTADEVKRYSRGKRDLGIEHSLLTLVDETSLRLETWLAAEQSSPSQQVLRQEQLVLLAEALAAMPEDQPPGG